MKTLLRLAIADCANSDANRANNDNYNSNGRIQPTSPVGTLQAGIWHNCSSNLRWGKRSSNLLSSLSTVHVSVRKTRNDCAEKKPLPNRTFNNLEFIFLCGQTAVDTGAVSTSYIQLLFQKGQNPEHSQLYLQKHLNVWRNIARSNREYFGSFSCKHLFGWYWCQQ